MSQDPEEEVQQKAFFSYFYLTINVGAKASKPYTPKPYPYTQLLNSVPCALIFTLYPHVNPEHSSLSLHQNHTHIGALTLS